MAENQTSHIRAIYRNDSTKITKKPTGYLPLKYLPPTAICAPPAGCTVPDARTLSPTILHAAMEYARSMSLLVLEGDYARFLRKDHFFRIHVEELCQHNQEAIRVLENPEHPVTIARVLRDDLSGTEQAALHQICREMLNMPPQQNRKIQLAQFAEHPWFLSNYKIRYIEADLRAWDALSGYGITPSLLKEKGVLTTDASPCRAEDMLRQRAAGTLEAGLRAGCRQWVKKYWQEHQPADVTFQRPAPKAPDKPPAPGPA
jgi:hypothetical protein